MRTLSLLALALASLLSLSAFAKPPDDIKSQFYNMGEQVIDGEIKRPVGVWTDGRKRAEFGRLLALKKSFLPAMQATSADKVFK